MPTITSNSTARLAVTLLLALAACDGGGEASPAGAVIQVEVIRDVPLPLAGRIRALGVTSTDDLVLMDSRIAPYLTVFDLDGDSVRYRLGRSGSGPGELVSPDMIDVTEDTPPRIWVLQANRRLLTRYRLDAAPVLEEERRLATGMALDAMAVLGAGVLAIGTAADSSAIFLGDSAFDTPRGLGRAPYRPSDLPAVRVFDANWAAMAVARYRNRVALAYRYAPEILILDTLGAQVIRWRSPDGAGAPRISPEEPWIPNFSFDSSEVAFLRVAVSDLGVMAVHCGCRGAELKTRDSLEVQLYHWEEGFAGAFRVPAPVTAIVSSRDGSRIFVATEEPEPRVIEYRVVSAGSVR